MRRTMLIAMLAVVALIGSALPALASRAVPVIATPALEEGFGASTSYIDWGSAPKSSPHAFVVYAKKRGGSRFRVSAAGTKAFGGGIDGTTLTYQQIDHGNSDIKMFDLVTKKRSDPPAGVDTGAWEYGPTVSGNFIQFARWFPSTSQRSVMLFNTATSRSMTLGTVRGRKNYAEPGQVNGTFATWAVCTPKCNVYLLNLTTGHRIKVPNPGSTYQYNPGVSVKGTVFFGRSGAACGSHANIYRYTPGGTPRLALRLPNGVDEAQIFVFTSGNKTTVYFDRSVCPHAFDIYKFTAS